jgi:hypothetical protein
MDREEFFLEKIRELDWKIFSSDGIYRFSECKSIDEFEEKYLSIRNEKSLISRYRSWIGGSRKIHMCNGK